MKIYRTRTQEEYDWLMNKLEDKGNEWSTGKKATKHNFWEEYKEETIIFVDEDGVGISYGDLLYTKEWHPNGSIIEVSELMSDPLAKKIEERNNKPIPTMQSDPEELAEQLKRVFPEDDPIEPQHYRKGEMDLFEAWSKIYPPNEYRAGMQMIAMRYMFRDKDDRVQDLNKAIETLERLKEYEEQNK